MSQTDPAPPLTPDDPTRKPTVARPDTDAGLTHVGVVGDTCTLLLTGEATNGRYCLIDMYVPPGGGPPPHRHDFEESFTVLEGEIGVAVRGERVAVRAGETAHVPDLAPHAFANTSAAPARLLCVCAPAGQEAFFLEVGVPVAGRTEAPEPLDEAAQATFRAKSSALAPKYHTELLKGT